MPLADLSVLTDEQLIASLCDLLGRNRQLTSAVVLHLAEVEARQLHLAAACSSMFDYCTRVLGFDEAAAYNRIQVARLAGIQAGKRTGELIPLCHILPGASLSVELEPDQALPGIRVRATAAIQGQTGVEMEALTATSIALVTIYDMVKALDRGMVMGDIRLVSKEGGASGSWTREKEL